MNVTKHRIKLATMEPNQVADEIGDFVVRQVLEMDKTGSGGRAVWRRGQHFGLQR